MDLLKLYEQMYDFGVPQFPEILPDLRGEWLYVYLRTLPVFSPPGTYQPDLRKKYYFWVGDVKIARSPFEIFGEVVHLLYPAARRHVLTFELISCGVFTIYPLPPSGKCVSKYIGRDGCTIEEIDPKKIIFSNFNGVPYDHQSAAKFLRDVIPEFRYCEFVCP